MPENSQPHLERVLAWGIGVLMALIVLIVIAVLVGAFTGHIKLNEIGNMAGAVAGSGVLGLCVCCVYALRLLVNTWKELEEARRPQQ